VPLGLVGVDADHLVEMGVDVLAGFGLDDVDVLLGQFVVELPERRLDAAADVGPLVLVERAFEVVPDVEESRHEIRRRALLFRPRGASPSAS